MRIASGHDLDPGRRGEVLLGATFATTFKKQTGDTIRLPVRPSDAPPGFVNHPFKVAGVLAATGSPTDSFAQVDDADARMLLADTLPPSIRSAVDVNNLAQGFTVFAANGTSLNGMDDIARRINATVPGVQAPLPSQSVQSFKSTSTTFTSVFTGAAVLALVIGGLSVINTMIMAVSERTREIGLKKAVGAHTGQVMREYILEAATIGAIGGLVGFGLGLGLTSLIDAIGHQSGYDIFLVTPRLAVVALLFAIGMATLAGIAPALRAARLDPETALRSL
jgi:putative ABC transport system permease protein